MSAAPNSVLSMPFCWNRLLDEPSTVRRPKGTRMFGSRDSMSSPRAWASAILIWSRMKLRSERTIWKPTPLVVPSTTGVCATGVSSPLPCTVPVGCEKTISVVPWPSW
ncbi:hypothetical protein D9M71_354970 [compost metagenome]